MFKAFLMILFGLALIGFSVKGSSDDRAFERGGKKAILEPIEQYTEVKKKRMQSHVRYEANVKFKTEEGIVISVDRWIPDASMEVLRSGQPLMIEYLPGDPTKTWLPGQDRGDRSGMMWLGVVLIVLGAFWWIRAFNAPDKLD